MAESQKCQYCNNRTLDPGGKCHLHRSVMNASQAPASLRLEPPPVMSVGQASHPQDPIWPDAVQDARSTLWAAVGDIDQIGMRRGEDGKWYSEELPYTEWSDGTTQAMEARTSTHIKVTADGQWGSYATFVGDTPEQVLSAIKEYADYDSTTLWPDGIKNGSVPVSAYLPDDLELEYGLQDLTLREGEDGKWYSAAVLLDLSQTTEDDLYDPETKTTLLVMNPGPERTMGAMSTVSFVGPSPVSVRSALYNYYSVEKAMRTESN